MSREHTVTETEFKEIVERLATGESSIKSAHHRIDELKEMSKDIKELASATTLIATETKALREDFVNVDKRIETLESKPVKRYETFVTACLTALAGGIVGYLISLVVK